MKLFKGLWRETFIILFSGYIGMGYNVYVLGKFYIHDLLIKYGPTIMLSDSFFPIILQGFFLSALFIGLPLAYFYHKDRKEKVKE